MSDSAKAHDKVFSNISAGDIGVKSNTLDQQRFSAIHSSEKAVSRSAWITGSHSLATESFRLPSPLIGDGTPDPPLSAASRLGSPSCVSLTGTHLNASTGSRRKISSSQSRTRHSKFWS